MSFFLFILDWNLFVFLELIFILVLTLFKFFILLVLLNLFWFLLLPLKLIFLAINFGFFITCPQSEMMKDNSCSNWNIQTGSLVCILGNVDKVVTNCYLCAIQTTAFVSQQKKGVTSERMILNWPWVRRYFYTTYSNLVLAAMLLYSC